MDEGFFFSSSFVFLIPLVGKFFSSKITISPLDLGVGLIFLFSAAKIKAA